MTVFGIGGTSYLNELRSQEEKTQKAMRTLHDDHQKTLANLLERRSKQFQSTFEQLFPEEKE